MAAAQPPRRSDLRGAFPRPAPLADRLTDRLDGPPLSPPPRRRHRGLRPRAAAGDRAPPPAAALLVRRSGRGLRVPDLPDAPRPGVRLRRGRPPGCPRVGL